MTDCRLPERWLVDRRLLKLSDSAHRTFITALLWSVSNRTDGRFEVEDLELMPRARPADVVELLAAGLLARDGSQLVLPDFPLTQTSRSELEVLENVRRRDREKKARKRAEEAPVPGDSPPGRPPGPVPGTAQAGRKEGRQEEQEHPRRGPKDVDGWPPVLCTTSGHEGCAWQNTDECADCCAVVAR